MRTLYVTGWCVSATVNKFAPSVPGSDVGNFQVITGLNARTSAPRSSESGLLLPSPFRGKSQVVVEVQETDGVWRAISTRAVFGAPDGDSVAPIDPKYFILNPCANRRIEFWIDRPSLWPTKARHLKIAGWCLAISGDEITEVRARLGRNIFSARFGRFELTLVFATIIDPARCGAVFHLTPVSRPAGSN